MAMSIMSEIDLECREHHHFSKLLDFDTEVKKEQPLSCPAAVTESQVSAVQVPEATYEDAYYDNCQPYDAYQYQTNYQPYNYDCPVSSEPYYPEYQNYQPDYPVMQPKMVLPSELLLPAPVYKPVTLKEYRNKQGKIRGRRHEGNQSVCDWIEMIMATENFASGHKLIQTSYGEAEKYGFKTVAFIDQMRTEKAKSMREYWIKGTHFSMKKLYYITKNSYKGDRAGKKNLFSLENIVIDIDNHNDTAKEVDFHVNRFLYLMENDYKDIFPRFGIVYTGRGVQLWIGMESVFASEKLIWRYEQLSEKLCGIIEKILSDNKIKLSVDKRASVRASGLVKLPETWNHKRRSKGIRSKKIHYANFPLYRYTMPELFREYTDIVLPFDEDSEFRPVDKADIVMPEKKQETKKRFQKNYNGFSAYQLKKVAFLEELVNENDGAMTGRREIVLFHYYNAACQVFVREDAAKMVKELNQKFTEPLHSNTVENTIRGIDTHRKVNYKNTGEIEVLEEGAYTRYNTITFLNDVCISDAEKEMYHHCTQGREKLRQEKRKKKQACHEQIQTLRQRGYTQQEIADTLHIAVSTVSRNLSESEAALKPSVRKRNAEILNLRKQGKTQKEIAEIMHISIPTVRKALQSYEDEEELFQKQQILALHHDGKNQREIAQALGISRYTVSNILKAFQQNTANQEEPKVQKQNEEVQEIQHTESAEKISEETAVPESVPLNQNQFRHHSDFQSLSHHHFFEPLCKLPAMRFKRGSPETKAGILLPTV